MYVKKIVYFCKNQYNNKNKYQLLQNLILEFILCIDKFYKNDSIIDLFGIFNNRTFLIF